MVFTSETYTGEKVKDEWVEYRDSFENITRFTGHGWQYNYFFALGGFEKDDVVVDIGGARSYLMAYLCNKYIHNGYIVDLCYEDEVFTFREWYSSLFGIDSFLEGRLNVIRCGAQDMPFKDNFFDKIVTCSAFEHFIDNDYDIMASKEAYRTLKCGGVFIGAVDYNPITTKPFGVDGGTIYTYQTFRDRIVEPAGWIMDSEFNEPSHIDGKFYSHDYSAIDQLFFIMRKH